MKNSAIAPTICVFLTTLFMLNIGHTVAAQNININSISIVNGNSPKKTIIYDDSKGLLLNESNDKLKKIDIYNKSGRKLMSIIKFNKTIHLRSLKSGSYHMTIELKSGELISRKLIKP